jgi:hypothetical protein
MIEFTGPPPSDAEAAAIAAALFAFEAGNETTEVPQSPWKLAMRLPDLDIDDVRRLARKGRHV